MWSLPCARRAPYHRLSPKAELDALCVRAAARTLPVTESQRTTSSCSVGRWTSWRLTQQDKPAGSVVIADGAPDNY